MRNCFNGYLTDECTKCEFWENGERSLGCACPFPIMHCEAFAKMFNEEEKRRSQEEIDSHCPYGGDCDYPKIRESAGSCTACPVGAAYSVPVDF